MKKWFVLAMGLFLCARAEALTSSNTGVTGLWEYPTAEIPADGRGRFGYTKASPYRFYFLDFAWLPWLEVTGRLTEFDNIPTSGRNYMDKAIDLKALIYRSGAWYLPNLAFGVMDVTGTELMKAYYGAATWRWGQFSVTAGYGSDRLNGFYAGLSWDALDWLTLKAEYSPLDYTKDYNRRVHPEEAKSKYNYGIVLKAPWGTEASISYQRGEEWSFTLSQRLNLNGPFLFSDVSDKRSQIDRPGEVRPPEWGSVRPEELVRNIKRGLEKYVRVRDVLIEIGDRTVLVAYENYGHASHAEAMVRVLVVLSAVLPQTESVTLVPRIHGVPVVSAEFPGHLMFDIRARTLREEGFLRPAVFTWARELPRRGAAPGMGSGAGDDGEGGSEDSGDRSGAYRAAVLEHRAQSEFKGMIVYEPRIDQRPDEYQNRWSLDLIYQGRYFNGWGLYVDVRFPFYNNIDPMDLWVEPDMNDYPRLQQAAALFLGRWDRANGDPSLWFFGEGGWLDEEYFGLNLWLRYYPKLGNWWVGTRLAFQSDREPANFASLPAGAIGYSHRGYFTLEESPWTVMAWAQVGYNFQDPDLELQVDWGSFRDTDVGVKISAVRHWDDTAFGFWWTRTDRLTTGRDYTRVGVHMEIPAEKWFGNWFGRPSEHIWEQDTMLLSSWRIKAGREGGHVRTPERLMSQLRPMALKRNVAALLEDYCSFEVTGERDAGPRSLAELLGLK